MRYAVRTTYRSDTDFLLYNESKELVYKFKRVTRWGRALTDPDDNELLAAKKIEKWQLTYEFLQNGHHIATLTEHGWLTPFYNRASKGRRTRYFYCQTPPFAKQVLLRKR